MTKLLRSVLVAVAGGALAILPLARPPYAAPTTPTDEQIAASFYPDGLQNDPGLRGAAPDTKTYQFTRADLDGTGSPDYLVVAYYNGLHDTVRIIKTAGVASVVGESNLNYIGGSAGQVSVVDLDGDGKPEIDLVLPTSKHSAHWLFKWSNGALRLFGPSETDLFGRQHTVLADLRVVDIDGDGIPELLVPAENDEYRTYRLVNGVYAAGPPVAFTYHLLRDKGDPDAIDVPVPAAPGDYILTIVNGDSRGKNRTTAAYAEVNGTVVFPENAFKKADHVLSAVVTLSGSNELYVESRGTPGTELTVSLVRKQ